jgi:hypothetical protein
VSDQRGRLLTAVLGFAGLSRPSYDRSLWALRAWLDSWHGIGAVQRGMAHQGFDLQLTRYDARGGRATFYTTGIEHSPTSETGSAWKHTPWHATERAAWEALRATVERRNFND